MREALPRRIVFPPAHWANEDGLIAVGGRPEPELLKIAYRRGIFPWPHDGVPLLWFCPDPRFVLVPQEAHLPRSLARTLRRGTYEVRADTSFEQVIRRCAGKRRPDQDGTWITEEMIASYTALHHEGLAHSIEAFRQGELVGGLYGLAFGAVFYGESMWSDAEDASKAAFATLLANLVHWGFELVDCQSYTDHLARFGAEEWPRSRFLAALKRALRAPDRQGRWELEVGPADAVAWL